MQLLPLALSNVVNKIVGRISILVCCPRSTPCLFANSWIAGCSFARTKLISNFFLTRFLTAGSIDDNKRLQAHHSHFVWLTVGVVSDVAHFMVT